MRQLFRVLPARGPRALRSGAIMPAQGGSKASRRSWSTARPGPGLGGGASAAPVGGAGWGGLEGVWGGGEGCAAAGPGGAVVDGEVKAQTVGFRCGVLDEGAPLGAHEEDGAGGDVFGDVEDLGAAEADLLHGFQ